MSMLAERRRKQKWSLNPTGKLWSSDSNKFGQKLLEKMGWSVGKGLGANEDGIKEHIKTSYKNDIKGIGYKETDDQWTQHESNFSKLLNTLRGDDSNEPEEIEPKESLEKKSQNSRARVHYHKFTRGKDLTRCSKKDLANIFGKKNLDDNNDAKPEPENHKTEETENDRKFGVETHNAGSMVDYFKNKFNFHKRTTVPICSDSETETPTFGFGFGYSKSESPNLETLPTNNEESAPCKKIKKKKKDKGLTNLAFDPTVQEEEQSKFEKENLEVIVEETEIVETPSVKKKKNKNKVLTNLAFDPMIQEKRPKVQEKNLNIIPEEPETVETPPIKKKKKKDKGLTNLAFDPTIQEEQPKVEEENPNIIFKELETVETPPIKKKKKKDKGLTNPAFDPTIQQEETIVGKENLNVILEEPEILEKSNDKIKKKRKNVETLDEGLSNPCFEEGDTIVDSVRRKKKKKSKIDEEAQSNYVESIQIETKKRKRDQLEMDNPCFNDSQNSINGDSFDNTTFEVKRRKKKKQVSGIENKALEMKSPEMPIEDENMMLNVISKAVPTQEKSSNTSNRSRKSVRFSNVNQQIYINKTDSPANLRKRNNGEGIDNAAFDDLGNKIEENVDVLSKELDNYQAEIENDLNEAKIDLMVGEVGDLDGENERLPTGETKLKFKHANFGRIPNYMRKDNGRAKASYRHLIKGDIILGFKNTNLHEIEGYAVKNSSVST